MIEILNGTLQGSTSYGFFLRTGPVVWEILSSSRTIRSLSHNSSSEIQVYTHLVVREDDLKIYGFADKTERELFRALLKVSGIGARQAVKILSFAEPGELSRLIEGADIDSLGKIPGIGKKTAQKMILSLQGELVTDSTEMSSQDIFSEIIESLVSMGFDKSNVRKVVQSCSQEILDPKITPRAQEQDIFRAALLELTSQEQKG
ncbi:MAG: Holliday junction branch migration protein RuvA [Spirochaeta sp.]